MILDILGIIAISYFSWKFIRYRSNCAKRRKIREESIYYRRRK